MKLEDIPVTITSDRDSDTPITLKVGGDSVSLSADVARALASVLVDEANAHGGDRQKAAKLHFQKGKP